MKLEMHYVEVGIDYQKGHDNTITNTCQKKKLGY